MRRSDVRILSPAPQNPPQRSTKRLNSPQIKALRLFCFPQHPTRNLILQHLKCGKSVEKIRMNQLFHTLKRKASRFFPHFRGGRPCGKSINSRHPTFPHLATASMPTGKACTAPQTTSRGMQMASKAYGFEAFLLPEKLQRRGKRPEVAKLKKSGAFSSAPSRWDAGPQNFLQRKTSKWQSRIFPTSLQTAP